MAPGTAKGRPQTPRSDHGRHRIHRLSRASTKAAARAAGCAAAARSRASSTAAGEPTPIELDHNALFHALQDEAFHASILTMKLDGDAQKVLLRDVQMHPFRNEVLHVDFQRVDENRKIHMKVPLHFVNEASLAGGEARRRDHQPRANELDVIVPAEGPARVHRGRPVDARVRQDRPRLRAQAAGGRHRGDARQGPGRRHRDRAEGARRDRGGRAAESRWPPRRSAAARRLREKKEEKKDDKKK